VFLVSHDRTFLDNVVTQVIVAEGEGNWREFVGGYSDWERVRDTVWRRSRSRQAKPPAPGTAPRRQGQESSASRNSANWKNCPS
jgi:ATP-binding cassette subfamily F protein uup